MTRFAVAQLLRTNWHLITALAILLIAASIMALSGQDKKPEVPHNMAGPYSTPAPQQNVVPHEPRKSDQEKALETIAMYREKVRANPTGKDAAAMILAMGNLYRQKLGDYEEAANCFEWMISDYSNAQNIREAYLQLVVCYEKLNDGEELNRLLLKMTREFPEGSNEYKFAYEQLFPGS